MDDTSQIQPPTSFAELFRTRSGKLSVPIAEVVARYELCEDLIRKDVTAIICQNDIMAVGVLDYCAKNDITVGEDIDLIGFDDRDIAKVCRPQLSTVALPLYDIGHKAADIIMDMINGKDEIPTGNILLGCHIVERASTGITQKQLKPIKR